MGGHTGEADHDERLVAGPNPSIDRVPVAKELLHGDRIQDHWYLYPLRGIHVGIALVALVEVSSAHGRDAERGKVASPDAPPHHPVLHGGLAVVTRDRHANTWRDNRGGEWRNGRHRHRARLVERRYPFLQAGQQGDRSRYGEAVARRVDRKQVQVSGIEPWVDARGPRAGPVAVRVPSVCGSNLLLKSACIAGSKSTRGALYPRNIDLCAPLGPIVGAM
ncbi:MAG TPA: hypothetical protein EYQ83_05130 [Acidobacteria bacterium]|nr:hypothetical protein [Acidobacteriota bacterium]